ncbi:hypothetical protein PMIT1323_01667 [Prochlorococcus marinus str. MIT 1323]|nr:hypothetical protein PMIT1323_01667 [Prochlorococcus marinus str. MIT 1323]
MDNNQFKGNWKLGQLKVNINNMNLVSILF